MSWLIINDKGKLTVNLQLSRWDLGMVRMRSGPIMIMIGWEDCLLLQDEDNSLGITQKNRTGKSLYPQNIPAGRKTRYVVFTYAGDCQ